MALFSNARSRTRAEMSSSGALDVLARVIRAWGQDAFDIDDRSAETFSARCEAWARHVLTGTPPPPRGPNVAGCKAPDDAADPTARRRYADLLGDMQQHRRRERKYVDQTMNGLKGAVWDVVTHLREAAIAQSRDDQVLQAQLSRLEALLDGDDVAAIREAASRTVRVVSDTIVARQERHAQQLAALGSQMKNLESSLAQAQTLNHVDALTGLQNRGALDERLPRLLTTAALYREPLSVLMVDIDHFKRINDTHGHPTGDAVLRAFSDALIRAFPRKQDYIARYGGEEFCVVLPGTDEVDAVRLGERFLQNLRGLAIDHEAVTVSITASIGVAIVDAADSADAVVARADRALYAAKNAGRDRVELASQR